MGASQGYQMDFYIGRRKGIIYWWKRGWAGLWFGGRMGGTQGVLVYPRRKRKTAPLWSGLHVDIGCFTFKLYTR